MASKRLFWIVLLAVPALGQSFYQFPSPLPNAQVYICGVPAVGNPCSNTASVFSSSTLTGAVGIPVTLGSDGNFGFWASGGQYTIQVQAPYNLNYVVTLGGGGSGLTTVGTFTNAVNYTPSVWTINGNVSPCTGVNEFQQFQPGTVVDTIEGVACEPVGATNHQVDGVAGYANTSANSSNRTVANAVGVYGSGRVLGTHGAAWGMNSIVGDVGGVSADNMESLEADINLAGSPTFVDAIQLNGISVSGGVFPVNAAEMDLTYNGPVRWPNGIHINPSDTTVSGVWLDAIGGTNSGSQVLRETATLSSVNTNWLDYTDQNGGHHANGAGTFYVHSTVGSLNPPALTAATVNSLISAGFVTNTTLTSGTFTIASGHSIVVGIQSGINGSNSITAVTDALGNAYTRLSSGVAGSRDQEFWISPCIAYSSSPLFSDTIKVTQGSSAALGFYAWDVAGLNCSQPFANSSAVQVATGTSAAAAVSTLTTISPNEVAFAFIVMSTTQTCTQGAGYTLNNGGSPTNICAENSAFATPYLTTTAPATFTSTTWWEGAISLQTAVQLGTPNNPWPLVNASKYQTATNCSQNVASPAPCGSATSGAVVIPTTTTTYTINTTAVTAHSRIYLTWLSFASDLPSSPTCVAPSTTTEPTISAVVPNTSFTITLTSTTGQTCPQFWIAD